MSFHASISGFLTSSASSSYVQTKATQYSNTSSNHFYITQIRESVPTSVHYMVTRSHAKLVLKALLATNHPLAAIDLDPTTYAQASKEQKWKDAMANELDALVKN
jgi:hypothetical protein